ncbi:hypothetical protein PIB30_023721 [Stylosanthes scabra]|uniref:Uncharacterized protein n=1 Tax=Stylosanthes scabra TaxID=79078 RepID=A0ABU6V8H9_9FABA|nr:hypothetical protein [Stylosanthes scabra]
MTAENKLTKRELAEHGNLIQMLLMTSDEHAGLLKTLISEKGKEIVTTSVVCGRPVTRSANANGKTRFVDDPKLVRKLNYDFETDESEEWSDIAQEEVRLVHFSHMELKTEIILASKCPGYVAQISIVIFHW